MLAGRQVGRPAAPLPRRTALRAGGSKQHTWQPSSSNSGARDPRSQLLSRIMLLDDYGPSSSTGEPAPTPAKMAHARTHSSTGEPAPTPEMLLALVRRQYRIERLQKESATASAADGRLDCWALRRRSHKSL
jgi:hypothetical protein